MAKLEKETRDAIHSYYNEKIAELESSLKFLENKEEKEQIRKFCEDEEVKHCKELINKIICKYPNYRIDGKLEINTYYTKFKFENEEYIKTKKDIEKLENERRLLILQLETNSKNTKEYKKAIDEFLKKIK